MRRLFLGWIACGLLIPIAAAQEPPAGQAPGQYGQRGGMRMGGMMGRGMMGTVTEVAADHFTIKNEAGESRTVNYSANTRFVKQPSTRQTQNGERMPMQQIAASDIKVGDAIAANGEVDASGNSVGAMLVVQLDPQRAQQMREMQANFGKTWLTGAFPEIWLFVLGALFVLTTLVFPRGIVGLFRQPRRPASPGRGSSWRSSPPRASPSRRPVEPGSRSPGWRSTARRRRGRSPGA